MELTEFLSPKYNKKDNLIMQCFVVETSRVWCSNVWCKALHSELLAELSSRNEFSRVETRRVESHFFVNFGNFGKTRLPKLAKMKIAKKRNFLRFFHEFSRIFAKNCDFRNFRNFGNVRKARTLPKYFRNSKNGDFRNSRKRKFW